MKLHLNKISQTSEHYRWYTFKPVLVKDILDIAHSYGSGSLAISPFLFSSFPGIAN